jgi:carboxymethylenebutenolidase
MKVIGGAVELLRTTRGCNGKVAVTGFCLGGAMAFAAAAVVLGVVSAVPFYGIARDEYVDWTKPKIPVQAHFGSQDGFISVDRARAVADKVNGAGGSLELHLYEAGHAFMREKDPHAYHTESAKLAWEGIP